MSGKEVRLGVEEIKKKIDDMVQAENSEGQEEDQEIDFVDLTNVSGGAARYEISACVTYKT